MTMKDKRIWIVIICILVIGTGVTHYTKYYVKSQATAMDTATTAGGMPAGAPSTASASEVKEEEQKEQEATEIPAPMGRSLGLASVPRPPDLLARNVIAGLEPIEDQRLQFGGYDLSSRERR